MSAEAPAANQKSNYAFEIRFVDDNIVQVFDIAAKRKQQNDESLLLPTEYKQEEVLKGQLRYSKLVGSDGHVEKDAFGLQDTGLPYQHTVTTQRSKNRRSTQRHTFFMMGGGGGGGSSNEIDMKPTTVSTIHDGDEMDDGYDSGTAVTEVVNDEYLDYGRDKDESIHHIEHQNSRPSSSTSIQEPPAVAWQPPAVIQQSEPVVLPMLAPTSLPPPVKQRERSTRRAPDHAAAIMIDQATTLQQQPMQSKPITSSASIIEMYQPTHSTVTFPTTTQDYTSITAVNTNRSSNSMPHQQQQQQKQQPKRGCCCIIS
ncbi:hypothetical protein V8B55DRAFT_1358871 [Mucor lusitanicus]|uniref:Uncharacterized protein n=2 Tax=Mucor circinelloides f. lusitanicus TaxID=29924 RepID=A0A168Q4R3_MUCCL|nr:hypothetical protein FB192DRAFT_1078996 [Mucor lusitanicus]OAD08693.1 hypothetical protein MUCCIDRAFT_76415 [Mucor lusitanicus CBS 277.49]